jgi:3-deoxy-D-manno-octulosonic-acid transferase
MGFWLRFSYNVAFTCLFFFGSPYYLWRLWQRGRLTQGFLQRFGIFSPAFKNRLEGGCDVWIHAVSVGENMIARSLVIEMRRHQPELRVVISATTPTGLRVANEDTNPLTTVIYSPVDFFWVARSVLKRIRPRRLLLVEAEVWPNLVSRAKCLGIPVYLLNARLSPRSEKRYTRFRRFTRGLFGQLDLVFAQDESEIPRLIRSGFPPERIFNLGSFKYDVANVTAAAGHSLEWWEALAWPADAPVLMAGSTHPGEEDLFLDLYLKLKIHHPHLRLILAPRHAERGTSILHSARQKGVKAVLRRELEQAADVSFEALILNTTGELRHVYAKATVVFVGKSLTGHGGQNYIEACQAGAPVILGPHMENFQFLVEEFHRHNAIVQVRDSVELESAIARLLDNPDERLRLAQAGQETFRANCGAAARTARVILESLAVPAAA